MLAESTENNLPWRRNLNRPSRGAGAELAPGQTEYEFGIPIPGVIQPREAWTKTALKHMPAPGAIHWEALFGRVAPVAIDIGCGNGRFTLASALERPEWDHFAIDTLPAVVRYGTRRANQRGLANLRFAVIDGWRMLNDYCGDASVDEIHIYHPQPYCDPKKVSRRMLTPDFLLLMHRRLKPQGRIFIQTDRPAYWEYIQDGFRRLFQWEPLDGPWPDGPQFRSRREILAVKQGLSILRGIACRRDDWTETDLQHEVDALHMPTFAVE